MSFPSSEGGGGGAGSDRSVSRRFRTRSSLLAISLTSFWSFSGETFSGGSARGADFSDARASPFGENSTPSGVTSGVGTSFFTFSGRSEYTPAAERAWSPRKGAPARTEDSLLETPSPGEAMACLISRSFWKAASRSFFSASLSERRSSSRTAALTWRTVRRKRPRKPPVFTCREERMTASGPRRSLAVRSASASSFASKVICVPLLIFIANYSTIPTDLSCAPWDISL